MTRWICLLTLLVACAKAAPAGPGAAANRGGTTGTPGGIDPGSDPNGRPEAAPGSVGNFGSRQVHLIGRIDTTATGGALLAWPGSGLHVRVIGASKVAVSMQSQQWGQFNSLAVFVDGKVTQTVQVSDSAAQYTVKVPDAQPHEVVLVKRNEAGNGVLLVSQLVTDGRFVDPTYDAGRHIEFVGDTVATGYAVDGPAGVTTCTKQASVIADPNIQNAANTYAVQTAMALGASWTIVAATSRGLINNLDGSQGLGLAEIYPRQNPFDVNSTGTFGPAPSVVVLSVGTQDVNYWYYHQAPDPNGKNLYHPRDTGAFTAAYNALIDGIRAKYPQARVVLTYGPTLSKYQCFGAATAVGATSGSCGTDPSGVANPSTLGMLQGLVQGIVAGRNDPLVTSTEFVADDKNISCDYMPSLAGHQKMAATLTAAIQAATGWSGPQLPAPNTAAEGIQTIASGNKPLVKPDLSGDPNVTGIDPDQYPWCQVCSPALYDTSVAGCSGPVGTPLACQSYCHMADPSIPWATDPPASGNHHPVPEAVLGEHATPVGRGHYIHSMEHGAVVIVYNCPNGCDAELNVIRGVLAQRPPPRLVIMTPDPQLKSGRFAALSWAWMYRFDIPDAAQLLCFIDQHERFGRECKPDKTCIPLSDSAMSIPSGGG